MVLLNIRLVKNILQNLPIFYIVNKSLISSLRFPLGQQKGSLTPFLPVSCTLSSPPLPSLFLFLFLFYLFLRERQSESGGRAEKEGGTESEAGSELSAQSPMWGHGA